MSPIARNERTAKGPKTFKACLATSNGMFQVVVVLAQSSSYKASWKRLQGRDKLIAGKTMPELSYEPPRVVAPRPLNEENVMYFGCPTEGPSGGPGHRTQHRHSP